MAIRKILKFRISSITLYKQDRIRWLSSKPKLVSVDVVVVLESSHFQLNCYLLIDLTQIAKNCVYRFGQLCRRSSRVNHFLSLHLFIRMTSRRYFEMISKFLPMTFAEKELNMPGCLYNQLILETLNR